MALTQHIGTMRKSSKAFALSAKNPSSLSVIRAPSPTGRLEPHNCNNPQQQTQVRPMSKSKTRSISAAMAVINCVVIVLLLFLLYYFHTPEEPIKSCTTSGCALQLALLRSMLSDKSLMCKDFHAFVCNRWDERNPLSFSSHFSRDVVFEIQRMLDEDIERPQNNTADTLDTRTLGAIYKKCLKANITQIIQQAHLLMTRFNVAFDNPNISYPLATALRLTAQIGPFGLFRIRVKNRLLIQRAGVPYLNLLQDAQYLRRAINELVLIINGSVSADKAAYYHNLTTRFDYLNMIFDSCRIKTYASNDMKDDTVANSIIDALEFSMREQLVSLNSTKKQFLFDGCTYSLIESLNKTFTQSEQIDVIRLLVFYRFALWAFFLNLSPNQQKLHCADDVYRMFPWGTGYMNFARRAAMNVGETAIRSGVVLLSTMIRIISQANQTIGPDMKKKLIEQFRQIHFTTKSIDEISELHSKSVTFFSKFESKIGFYSAYVFIFPMLFDKYILIQQEEATLDTHVPRLEYYEETNEINVPPSNFVTPWFFTGGVESLNAGSILVSQAAAILELTSDVLNLSGHFQDIFDKNATLRDALVRNVYNRFNFSALEEEIDSKNKFLLEHEKSNSVVFMLSLWMINEDDQKRSAFRRDQLLNGYSSDALFYIGRCLKFCTGSRADTMTKFLSRAKCNAPLYDNPTFLTTFNCGNFNSAMSPNKYRRVDW